MSFRGLSKDGFALFATLMGVWHCLFEAKSARACCQTSHPNRCFRTAGAGSILLNYLAISFVANQVGYFSVHLAPLWNSPRAHDRFSG